MWSEHALGDLLIDLSLILLTQTEIDLGVFLLLSFVSLHLRVVCLVLVVGSVQETLWTQIGVVEDCTHAWHLLDVLLAQIYGLVRSKIRIDLDVMLIWVQEVVMIDFY